MNRRQFFKDILLGLTSTKIMADVCVSEWNKYKQSKIYGLPEFVELATMEYTLPPPFTNLKAMQKGYGVVVNGEFITQAHITESPEGSIEKKVSVRGKTLEEKFFNTDIDVAVYSFNEEDKLEDFPCKPNIEYKMGERIYVIGNPRLKGSVIRPGHIIDIDGMGSKMTAGCFGIDVPLIPGDSGGPVVNSNLELLGLSRCVFNNNMGYVTKIEHYLENL